MHEDKVECRAPTKKALCVQVQKFCFYYLYLVHICNRTRRSVASGRCDLELYGMHYRIENLTTTVVHSYKLLINIVKPVHSIKMKDKTWKCNLYNQVGNADASPIVFKCI